jgi:PleD family two-component response regulator
VTDAPAKPVILVATREPSLIRDVESALWNAGYRVLLTRDERDTVEQAHQQRPHAIVLDRAVAPPGYGLCDTLRADPAVGLCTPIILTQAGPTTRAQRHDALRAGAWDLRGAPFDTDELLLRLGVYLESKLEVDRLTAECFVDRSSGLYNREGLERRAEELGALVNRQGLDLACAVFRPKRELPAADRAAADRLARAFKTLGRTADAIGRTAPTEFAVFAPATNTWGAARLVRRLSESVDRELGVESTERGQPGTLRAGYVAAVATHKVSPIALLARARQALESGGTLL